MTVDEALLFLDSILQPEHLNDVQELVFRQAWEGRSYPEIARNTGYDAEYIKFVGFQLWQLLSRLFGEKVTKSNVHSVLRRKAQQVPVVVEPSNSTSVNISRNTQIYQIDTPGWVAAEESAANRYQDWGEANAEAKDGVGGLTHPLLSGQNLLQNLELLPSPLPTVVKTGLEDRLATRIIFSQESVSRYRYAFKASRQADYPERPLAPNSSLYIERPPIELDCDREILKPGSLIRIKAPKNMGKTSLLNRVLARAANFSCRTVRLNFRQVESAVLSHLDKFLRWFCVNISQRLQMPSMLDEYWDEELFGSMASCTTYFQAYLLTEIDAPLVLGLDEVDRLFEYPEIARDFFALLRGWHEEANNLDIWQRLRMVVVHSTEVYIPLNINQSPFNVGLPIHLPEFTGSQVQELAACHGLDRADDMVSSQGFTPLIALVGGHPYLLQLALYYLGRQEITLENLLNTAATQAGIYGEYLRSYWEKLRIHPELVDALKRLVDTDKRLQLEPTLAYKLESMGLVKVNGNEANISCELYRRYFRELLRN
ncbi:AAA-like domain-containing protein [Funiculus sociatus GB2-M2]|uniref:AAA-like domain-containing protein n=1 Tax=Cyanophyceae TaxID=3028117 RepID=UPI0018F03B3B|nr:AAA-like domain-containing protein [Trichocoleus sp. FACHB-90]